MSSHCELSLSLQLWQWAHCYHCMVSSSVDLTNSSRQAQQVSCKLTESSQQAHSVSHPVSALWCNWVSSKWAFHEFQCELPVTLLWAQILHWAGRAHCDKDCQSHCFSYLYLNQHAFHCSRYELKICIIKYLPPKLHWSCGTDTWANF